MTHLSVIPAAKLGDATLSVGDCLLRLQQRRRLQPLLRELAVEAFLLKRASEMGVNVSVEQLQLAADNFRRRHGLMSTAQTNEWLEREGLVLADLEAALERDVLITRLREHITAPLLEAHFEEHRSRYDRVRLAQIVVPQQDLARELLTQLRDEGADFAQLAREHSLHAPSRDRGGAMGVLCRRQVPDGAVDAVFLAKEADIVGPVALSDGFHLYRIEGKARAELDSQTTTLIREELFQRWLSDQLAAVKLELPVLEAL